MDLPFRELSISSIYLSEACENPRMVILLYFKVVFVDISITIIMGAHM
jgi:hypothetical protein